MITRGFTSPGSDPPRLMTITTGWALGTLGTGAGCWMFSTARMTGRVVGRKENMVMVVTMVLQVQEKWGRLEQTQKIEGNSPSP